jgi:dUTP pyrophosphatase
MIKILIKRQSDKVLIPKYETDGSSGMDISAYLDNNINIKPGDKAMIPTGFSLSIPEGYEVQIRPRSGLAAKKSITVLNTPGTIDADYRGEIKVILINLGKESFIVENGMRMAQMVVCPVIKAELETISELSETSRGKDGFGSTGTK